MLEEQYPSIFIFVTLGIGFVLAVTNPYRGFLLGVVILAAANTYTAARTRTILGPYFNLFDAVVVVLLLSFIFELIGDRRRTNIVPPLVMALVFVIAVGFVEGTSNFGWRYEVLRATRWAINVPILILMGANFVNTRERARSFLVALFVGAILATVQHFAITHNILGAASPLNASSGLVRNVGFLFSPITYFPVAAAMRPMLLYIDKPWRKTIWWLALVAFVGSVIFSQTRSLWIAIAIAPVPIAILLRETRILRHAIVIAALAATTALFVLPRFFPEVDTMLQQTVFSRVESLTEIDQFESTTRTRWNALEIESRDWIEGNWLSGNGFEYQLKYPYGFDTRIAAWGHLGYVSYLVRLGVIGFFVYAILLPITGITAGRKLYAFQPDGPIGDLAILVISSIVVDGITFVMSGSYLFLGVSTSALLVGAAIGLRNAFVSQESRSKRARRARIANQRRRKKLGVAVASQTNTPQVIDNVTAHSSQ
jgi:hypothetical protein